jgi:D-alanyl-D-alanine carboxypeptidase (penicillin-binding protein 5/6)
MSFDCESVLLMDATTGTILYEQNSDKALPPASVTKIMTLLLVMEAIERGELRHGDTVTASAYAASMGGSQIYLKEGEQMCVDDLIKSVVIASANDAAVALAEHLCGSEQVFVDRMNERAQELGMRNTYFENTNGLDDTTKNHLTSARDIAIMSRELIKYDTILKYSSTWMDNIRNGEFGLTNTNRLIRFFNGATGLKTGSTDKAKFCISATAKRGNMHLICVVMGAPTSTERNNIASTLLNWGFANFELYENSVENLNNIKVSGGVEDYCSIMSKPFAKVVKKGEKNSIEKRYVITDKTTAPIDIDQCLGYIEYYLNGDLIGKSEIVSTVEIEKITFLTVFVRLLSKFLIK